MEYLSLLLLLDEAALLRALIAFTTCVVLLPLAVPVARRLGMVDVPGGRKQHKGAIPVIGGIVILVASLAAFALFEDSPNLRMTVFAGCMALLVLVGQLDDLRDLRWYWR